jgi:hypothetical protein
MKLIRLKNVKKYYLRCDLKNQAAVLLKMKYLHGPPCRLVNT